MMKLKVCGMRDTQNIQDLLAIKLEFMGFIFYDKSPRNATGILNENLLKSFPNCTKKVGVFVNEEITKMAETVMKYDLDLVQLHGDESVEYVSKLKGKTIEVIKAFAIDKHFNFDLLSDYMPFVDYFLFDTKGEERGGTGRKFDWGLLKNYHHETPFFLSGGISVEDAKEFKNLKGSNIFGLDVNSRFELKPGDKDIIALENFTNELYGKID
jgi:phosphoribosylanthranilate isomerase